MKQAIVAVLVLAAVAARPLEGRQTSLTGDWTFSVERLGLRLVLEQKKSAVTGTLDWPHGDPIKLIGMFADETLLLSGDSAGENFTIHIDARGTRTPDGAMAGTVKAHFDEFNDAHQIVRARNQEIPWTAVRGLHDIVHFPR
jgi:hypothetical protein